MKPIYKALLLLSITTTAFADKTTHWDYTGKEGAEHWAELDAAFEMCAKGQHQSPINIDKTVKTQLPNLEFHYQSSSPTLVNNGHTVQVNLPAGNTLTIGDKNYDLVQFHFHTPSEEEIHGKHLAMVAHFVHKNSAGELGVVAVLFEKGTPNQNFAPIFEHLPHAHEKIVVDDLNLDLSKLLPSHLAYYSFEGSLTTPPCSENVSWMVLKEPVTIGKDQLKAFRQLFHANARPIQALHDRVIKESI